MNREEINSSLGEELGELDVDPGAVEEEAESSQQDDQPKKRGRPFIPNKWLQVISLDHDAPLKLNMKDLTSELIFQAASGASATMQPRDSGTRRERGWAPVFCPRQFAKDNDPLTMAQYKLSDEELRNNAITISKLRWRVKKEASQLEQRAPAELEDGIKEVEGLDKEAKRRGHSKTSLDTPESLPDFKMEVPIGCRKRRRRRGTLTLANKVDIAHQVLVQLHMQKEVAKQYRVSQCVVSAIITKAKKSPDFLQALHEKEVDQKEKKAQVTGIINDMITADTFIDSAAQVQAELKERAGLEYEEHAVRAFLSKDLGMSYKKVTSVSLHANSEKNRVLRQRFALQLIGLLNQGKRILNVDETWLGMTDFRRMKWRARGSNNSVSHVQLAPRISMIVGLDTTGAVYLSILQANNDSRTMELFFKNLALKLDSEDARWRENTVILLDNVSTIYSSPDLIFLQASYHTSAAAYDMMAALQLPVIFTGAHSYDASPIEKWFAHFKRADVNPRRIKTGKR